VDNRLPLHSGCAEANFSMRCGDYLSYPFTRTIDNHIMKFRQKLERQSSEPVTLSHDPWGVGTSLCLEHNMSCVDCDVKKRLG